MGTLLMVDGGMLFFGTGVRKNFGGNEGGNPMVAFRATPLRKSIRR